MKTALQFEADPESNYIIISKGEDCKGKTYYYDHVEDKWTDIEHLWEDDGISDMRIFLVARGKETEKANGGDFSVASLDDSGSDHSSVIYLGKADELYGKDAAHPDRRTLSNMTVNLAEGVVNSYGGTITGEGAVTKTGPGSLILSGENTHMGLTAVNEGLLAVNGSLTMDTGVLCGKGSIGGTLTNSSVAVAGSCRSFDRQQQGRRAQSGYEFARGQG